MLPADDPLDPETMAQLRAIGDDAFIVELAEMYLTDFEPAYKALLQAIAGDDHPTAASKAHFLKGSSVGIGLVDLGAVLADVEHHFRDGSSVFNDGTMRELEARAEQGCNRLRLLVSESEEFDLSGR